MLAVTAKANSAYAQQRSGMWTCTYICMLMTLECIEAIKLAFWRLQLLNDINYALQSNFAN